MRFVREHKKAIIFSLLFFIVFVFIVVSYINNYKHGPVKAFITKALVKVETPFSKGGYKLRGTSVGIFKFKEISRENEELKEKIQNLEKKIIDEQMSMAELEELRELAKALNYEYIAVSNYYVTADVSAMDKSKIFNNFTINAGKEKGISENSVVVNGDGLIGRISLAENGYSKVISVIDEMNSVSFMVQRDMNIIGILNGNGKAGLQGFTLDAKAEIIKGDVLITSGMGTYPAGIRIGKVSDVSYNKDTQLKTVEVKPFVNFKKIQKVLVAQ